MATMQRPRSRSIPGTRPGTRFSAFCAATTVSDNGSPVKASTCTLIQGLGSIISPALRFSVQHLLTKQVITLIKTNAVIQDPASVLEVILQNQWIVLSGLRSLRISSKDGGPCNEYRIQESSVEFRSVDAQAEPSSHSNQWRTLDGEEIRLHFALETPVAEWLDKNLYATPSAA
jgi:hypothetical protein